MSRKENKKRLHQMVLAAVLMAILIVMSITPLGYLKVGPLEITFLTIPVAVGAVIIARDDVDEKAVYNVISGIYDSVDTLAHDKKNELSLDFAASVTAVPYHPGAAKYLAEKGFNVSTK